MILYSCGCRYKTQEREAANQHVVMTGHTMTVHGLLRQEELLEGKLLIKALEAGKDG